MKTPAECQALMSEMKATPSECLRKWWPVISKCAEIPVTDREKFALMLECSWYGAQLIGYGDSTKFANDFLPVIRRGIAETYIRLIIPQPPEKVAELGERQLILEG